MNYLLSLLIVASSFIIPVYGQTDSVINFEKDCSTVGGALTAEVYYYEGQQELNEGNLNKARQNFECAIYLDTNYTDAYFYRGIVAHYLKRDLEAIGYYNKVIQIDSSYEGIYDTRGYSYQSLNRLPEALEDYNKALSFSNKNWKVYYNRGNIFIKLESYKEALSDFEQAVKFNPTHGLSYYKIAWLNLTVFKDSKGCESLKKALQLKIKDDKNLSDECCDE
jgi:tetratricopeptide (TPR) repeat protein